MPKFNDYPASTAPNASDLVLIRDSVSNSTKKVTRSNFIGSITPAQRTGGFMMGLITGATLSTTGLKPVTGVGFTPKLVKFTGIPGSSSTVDTHAEGAMSAVFQYMLATASTGSTAARNGNIIAAFGYVAAGSASLVLRCNYSSMDADGFTVNCVTANGGLDWVWEAYG